MKYMYIRENHIYCSVDCPLLPPPPHYACLTKNKAFCAGLQCIKQICFKDGGGGRRRKGGRDVEKKLEKKVRMPEKVNISRKVEMMTNCEETENYTTFKFFEISINKCINFAPNLIL